MPDSTYSIRVFPLLEKVNHNLMKELFIDNIFLRYFVLKSLPSLPPKPPDYNSTQKLAEILPFQSKSNLL